MKIIISYPPLDTNKGLATLGQNRQFQYFKEPTFIYPVVPAVAAAMLKKAGHEVIWNDCLAEGMGREDFKNFIQTESPDLVVFESKTPVIKQHWDIIGELKRNDENLKIALFGDHVTALPEESFHESLVDFVITGGDYDFLLKNLCDVWGSLKPGEKIRADLLEPGIYYREENDIKNTGVFKLDHNLNEAPFIDRNLTKWHLYAYKNGNYKRTPGSYIMSGRDCWWGKCSFCSWPALYPSYRVRLVENVLNEIGCLIDNYKVREVMDDTGTLPVGRWLRDFCKGMRERGYHRKIYLDCNMRFDGPAKEDYKLMKEAGFRLLLFGLESGNQKTLDRLKKGIRVEKIIESCRQARAEGLYPHITIMFGYPWESYEEAKKTYELGKWLLLKGYAYTMQATLVIPYPGTPLFEECRSENLLTTLQWSEYDMKKPVMKIKFSQDKLMQLIQQMYAVSYHPKFLLKKIITLRDFDDILYFAKAGKKVFGHLRDFAYSKIRSKTPLMSAPEADIGKEICRREKL